jgi:hypothetical protein
MCRKKCQHMGMYGVCVWGGGRTFLCGFFCIFVCGVFVCLGVSVCVCVCVGDVCDWALLTVCSFIGHKIANDFVF